MKIVFLLGLSIMFVSCASKPKLYPNEKYKSVGKSQAEADITICSAEAEEYLESSQAKKITKGAGKGAFIGAAIGAASGIFSGNVGRDALRGGTVGAAAGGAGAAISPDQLKRRYVNHCLSKKGYRVLGWD